MALRRNGQAAMAELLLQRGASPNVHVDSSGSPVYAAYSHRQWAMVDLLKQHGGVVTPDIVGLYRETDLAKELLAGRSDTPRSRGHDPARSIARGLSAGVCAERRRGRTSCAWRSNVSTGRAMIRRWFRMLGRGLDFWNHIPWLMRHEPRVSIAART